jgi:hypothetical protein
MKLTPEEVRALAEKAPSMAAGLSPALAGSNKGGLRLTETGLSGAAALARLREMAELVVSTPLGDTLYALSRTIRLSRDSAAKLIERIDRGDDPQEIMSFVHAALSDSRSEDVEGRRRDDGA